MMKKSIAVMTLASVLALHAVAQPPAPPAPRPGANGMMPPPRPGGAAQPLQEVTTYTGQAGQWATNPDYVYDGFYLQTNGSNLLVKFPPHMGEQIKAAVNTGSSVTVKGVLHTAPDSTKEIRLMSLTAGGKTIADTGSRRPAPGTEPTEASTSGSGKVAELQKGKMGETNGLILDNKTILRVPPHVLSSMSNLSAGSSISYTGTKKSARSGEVSSGNYTIVHTKTLTVNGKEYLVR